MPRVLILYKPTQNDGRTLRLVMLAFRYSLCGKGSKNEQISYICIFHKNKYIKYLIKDVLIEQSNVKAINIQHCINAVLDKSN